MANFQRDSDDSDEDDPCASTATPSIKATAEGRSEQEIEDGEVGGLHSNIKLHKQLAYYPTRYQRVGEMQCFFLSCFKKGRSPFCTVGPSKAGCMFMFCFGGFCLAYLFFMISIFSDKNPITFFISVILVLTNLIFFLCTMFGDHGVPTSVYERYYKLKYVGLKVDGKDEEEIIVSDEE